MAERLRRSIRNAVLSRSWVRIPVLSNLFAYLASIFLALRITRGTGCLHLGSDVLDQNFTRFNLVPPDFIATEVNFLSQTLSDDN